MMACAATAIVLWSARDPGPMAFVGGLLWAGAAAVVTVVRRRLLRELRLVGESHGLPPSVAHAEAREVVVRALRLQ